MLILIKRNVGTDVNGKLSIWDQTNTTYIGTTNYVASDTWTRISVTATTNGTAVSAQNVLRLDTNGDSVFAWGSQFEEGDAPTAYIRTFASIASLSKCDYRVADIVPIPTGRVESTVSVASSNGSDQMAWSTESTVDWRAVGFDSTNTDIAELYDGSAVSWHSFSGAVQTNSSEVNHTLRWDVTDNGRFGEDADRSSSWSRGSTVVGSSTDATTYVAETSDLMVGQNHDLTGQLDGFIQIISVSNSPGVLP